MRQTPREKTYTPTFPGEGQPRTETCPDCITNGSVDIVGRPFRLHREPLRPVTDRLPYNQLSSAGCLTCDGTGRVVVGAGDPYKIAKKG